MVRFNHGSPTALTAIVVKIRGVMSHRLLTCRRWLGRSALPTAALFDRLSPIRIARTDRIGSRLTPRLRSRSGRAAALTYPVVRGDLVVASEGEAVVPEGV